MARNDRQKGQKSKQPSTPPPRPATGQPNRGNQRTEQVDKRQRVTITATLLEDTHLGSGSGSAGVDALIARDRHGRPVVWASHLEGVLRDASLRLYGEVASENFFGIAGGNRQNAIFTSLYTTQDTSTRIWRSSARTAYDNRAPKAETLRSMEYISRNTRFEGNVEVRESDLPILKRLLKEIDSLGSGRASGAGRVEITLTETRVTPKTVTGAKQRLILCLYSHEPICITSTATPNNLLLSESFLPGRSILGAITRWLLDAGKTEEAKLLVGGNMSISDAFPLPSAPIPNSLSTSTVLPAPLTLQHRKPDGSPGAIPWWASKTQPTERLDKFADDTSREKLKRPDADLFVYRSSPQTSWTTFKPQLRVRLRNGRPKRRSEEPELFAIEEIAEKTYFLCEISGKVSDMSKLSEALSPVLDGSSWLRIGRGGAPVEVKEIHWADPPEASPLASKAILTLTSDLLFRDDYLRWCMFLDKDTCSSCSRWPQSLTITRQMQEPTPIYGFNGTSGMWRMPAYAIRRGSVFLVEGVGVKDLAQLASKGLWLGERTHEGFGRFRLDSHLPGVTGTTATIPNATPPLSGKPDDPQEIIAKTTHDWLKQHRRLAGSSRNEERVPSLSQWFDFVADLEQKQKGEEAITERKNADTAGGQTWTHKDANALLDKLLTIDAESRVDYARLFVRWLRAEMKRNKK